jgi:hypothetical protein
MPHELPASHGLALLLLPLLVQVLDSVPADKVVPTQSSPAAGQLGC